jgi:hypothetical protein
MKASQIQSHSGTEALKLIAASNDSNLNWRGIFLFVLYTSAEADLREGMQPSNVECGQIRKDSGCRGSVAIDRYKWRSTESTGAFKQIRCQTYRPPLLG